MPDGSRTEMLCHESGCLDGEGVNDYWCAGWVRGQS